MNHEFRAEQQAARERQAHLARANRYRMRAYYLLAALAVMTIFWLLVFARR